MIMKLTAKKALCNKSLFSSCKANLNS